VESTDKAFSTISATARIISSANGRPAICTPIGSPSLDFPAGRSKDGLPIGVQIAGPPFAEEMILAAAEIVETALSTDYTDSEL